MQDLQTEPIKPIYDYTPKLALGEDVEMQPEWQKDIDEGRCELAP